MQGRRAGLRVQETYMTVRHLQQRCEICSFVRLFVSTPGWLQGMTESESWSLREVLIRLLEAFQRRIPPSAKSQRRREFVAEEKKSEMRWKAAVYIARRPSHFGGLLARTPQPCIGSFFIQHEPITCSYNCVVEIGFS